MLHKSRGIVFRTTEYGETSLIVRIYTELFGIQNYIINSVRKKHARIHSNVFQALTPVDLVVYHKDRPGLQRIADVKPNPPLMNLSFDIQRSSMIFFLDEVLNKSIHEEEPNPSLFEFIYDSVIRLDAGPVSNDFHLVFLLQLSRHLGFYPVNNFNEANPVFNLREGRFQSGFPDHPHFLSGEWSRHLSGLIDAGYRNSSGLTAEERRKMIDYLLEFYELHIDGFGKIKSHKVLEQVWE